MDHHPKVDIDALIGPHFYIIVNNLPRGASGGQIIIKNDKRIKTRVVQKAVDGVVPKPGVAGQVRDRLEDRVHTGGVGRGGVTDRDISRQGAGKR